MFSNRIGRRVAVMVSALAFTLGSSAVLAQPGPGAGFGHGAGRGPGGDNLGQIFAQFKTQLALTPDQEAKWSAAVAVGKESRQRTRVLMQQTHDQVKAALSKDSPDLQAISTMMDAARQQAFELRKPARAAWLDLYASLSPQQKAIVRDALLARMQRHEQMLERFQQRLGAPQG
jgi:Spy/CpxP family protein refolding chaperone